MSPNTPPTLTDPVGLGGIIAVDGFDYQLWDGLARLPAWLANPTFEGLFFEGLEDLEARFFAPHAPRSYLVERYQAKSAQLSPKQVREVFEAFHEFEAAYPRAARTQTLVTPILPPTLSWLSRDPSRVRRARPFYAPFSDIVAASDAKLRVDLVDQFGAELGVFVAENVEVSEQNIPSRDQAANAFTLNLSRLIPGLTMADALRAFEALNSLVRAHSGVPITREALIDAIGTLADRFSYRHNAFPLHIRSDRNERAAGALEIDASAFSGQPFPPSSGWAGLLDALNRTARWMRQQSVARVSLSGSYRLSTAMALGFSLRSAIGFELLIPTRDGPWATDDRPAEPDSFPPWQIAGPSKLENGTLLVSVGVLRDPAVDLKGGSGGSTKGDLLRAFLAQPVRSARQAQHGVALVKAAVAQASANLQPERIELYFAGPAAFAVALGHRWNGLPPTQLHEFVQSDRTYVPTGNLT